MTEIHIAAGQQLFVGSHPEHLESAKKYVEANGFTKDDVRLYKKTRTDEDEEGNQFTSVFVIVETIRPQVLACGVMNEPLKGA